MPRTLSDERCEIIFRDHISGTDIPLYYTMPTTEERVAFSNEQIVRKGDKVINKTGETRLKYGLKILAGFGEGAFAKGKNQPISSDPQSPHYDPAWKALVRKYASDLAAALAVVVFEVSASPKPPEVEEAEEAPAAEDPPGEESGEGAAPAPAAGEGGSEGYRPLQD